MKGQSVNGERSCVIEEETNEAMQQTKFHVKPNSSSLTSFDIWVRFKEDEEPLREKKIIFMKQVADQITMMVVDLELNGTI